MNGRLRAILGLLILSLALLRCGGATVAMSASSSSDGSSGSSITDEVVGGNITQLSVSLDSVSVQLSGVQAEDELVLMVYSYNSGSTTEGFQVSTGSVSEKFLGIVESNEGREDDVPVTEIEGHADLTEEFHTFLRAGESEIEEDALMASTTGLGAYARYVTGAARTFKVLNSFSTSSSYETVSATLRHENEYFQFYVDDRDVNALSDSDLTDLANDFSDVIPLERQYFGEESDVNGDGKFAVLFTHTVNSLGASSGGIVTGFFYAVDLFDDAQYPLSNEMEIYYTFVPDEDGDFGSAISKSFALSNILPGVLPHEYQHMINFNEHYFVNGGSAEQGWLNEGLSHLAEDIYTSDESGYMAASGLENPARVASYLSGIANICFSCGTSLSQRGGSYLFLRYLYEQAEKGLLSGASSGGVLIQALLDTNLRGLDNLISAAFDNGTSDDLKDVLGLFGLAVYLSNTGLADSERLNFDGVDLRSVQDDNRGTVLSGPSIQFVDGFPYTDTLSGNSMIYMQLTGDMISENNGVVNFSFDPGADFGGYVIQE